MHLPNYTVARYAVDVAQARRSLLPITDTLPLAETFRRVLLGRCRRILERESLEPGKALMSTHFPSLLGKDAEGNPLFGHRHAFFLPTDEDADGRLDHVTIVAEQGLTPDEVRAIDRLRCLPYRDGDPLRLLLVGLGTQRDLCSPLFAASPTWVSATPFLSTRYPKRRGAKRDQPEHYATPQVFAGHVLGQELQRLRERRPSLPEVVAIQPLEAMGRPRALRTIQFVRDRQKAGDDGGRRPGGAFRIVFAAPTTGPLCLGHSCHFGLGLFWPEETIR